jgi:hypothetical protein
MAHGGTRPNSGRPRKNRANLISKKPTTNNAKIPAEQGIVGYKNPPSQYSFKPGQSGNPNGRPTAGATLREWVNVLAAKNLSEKELRRLARDQKVPWPKRAAANRILRTLEVPDLADLEDVLTGDVTLKQAREQGLNTEVVKKMKVKTRYVLNRDGDAEKEIEREVELFDRAGVDFDRVTEHTDGRPAQGLHLSGEVNQTIKRVVIEDDGGAGDR